MHTQGRKKTRGQTLVDYAMLVALISVVAIAILHVMGRRSRDLYVSVNDAMATSSVEVASAPALPAGWIPPPPPGSPWWQPFLVDKYNGYLGGGDSPEEAYNKAMGDLGGLWGGDPPGDMPNFGEAGGWLGGQIGG